MPDWNWHIHGSRDAAGRGNRVERIPFYMNELEQQYLQQNHPDLWEHLKDNIEVYEPVLRKTELKKELNDKLGALASEYGYRVAEDSEVPGVRNVRGLTPDKVVFDEAHNLSEVYASGEQSVTTQKWLEHRSVCRRTLLECLSGEQH